MINESIKNFIESLAKYHAENVFNPWADTNPDYEIENAVILRRRQLEIYLSRRLSTAKLLLIAEACGYQGGHFTGIAMTCERMILGYHKTVTPMMILGKEGTRTSRKDSLFIKKEIQREKGFNEPTDTVAWSACLEAGLGPDEFILWNIFPFHPYKKGCFLSNRTPTDEELSVGLDYTRQLLEITGTLPIFAVGKKSEITLYPSKSLPLYFPFQDIPLCCIIPYHDNTAGNNLGKHIPKTCDLHKEPHGHLVDSQACRRCGKKKKHFHFRPFSRVKNHRHTK